jgi:hypothetical protein
MTKPTQQAKMTVQFTSYKTYVMDADKILQVMALLKDAEMFESVYHSTTSGGNGKSTLHVYPNDTELSQPCNVQFISDAAYALGKIAGKPPEKD